MSAQKTSAPAKLAAWAAAAALVVLTVAVGLRLAVRRDGDRPAAAVKLPPGAGVIDLKERVRHEEYRDGKLHAAIRGEHFSLGPDGRNHLEGAVEVTNYDPAGKVVSRITADHLAYDKSAVLFAIAGRVRVEAEGVVLEGSSFEYDKSRGLFRAASGGVFSSNGMAGTAPEISYSESADEVRLAGGFRVDLNGTDPGAAEAVLSGDSLSYQRGERRGRAEGRVEFAGGRCRGSAAAMDFDVAEGSSLLKYVVFDGAAELVIAGTGADRVRGGGVRADKVQAAFFPGSDGLSRVNALGNSRLSLSLSPASKSLIEAGRALLTFGTGEELERLDASGGCRAELDDGAGKGRILEGESVSYDASTRVLLASGERGRPAVASSSDARGEAPDIVVGPAAGDLEASAGVMCLLKPDGERQAGGFFSASEPVFLSCSRLIFLAEKGVFSFLGGVRAWQGRDFVLAGELDLMETTRDMRARGGVVAGLAQAVAAGGPERRIEVGGEDMTYSTASRALSFMRKSYLRLPGARLDAETVGVGLGLDEGSVETLTAHSGVVLSKGRYEGRGEAALYQAETDRVTLTGRPVLVDKEGGSTRGDKLTFDLGDDKILIENEGQGRSTTIVKS
jgi:lipopolysaccharide export system protein LptA